MKGWWDGGDTSNVRAREEKGNGKDGISSHIAYIMERSGGERTNGVLCGKEEEGGRPEGG